MCRFVVILVVALALPASGLTQDSGPGPTSTGAASQYNVTLLGWSATSQGTFTFTASSDGTGTGEEAGIGDGQSTTTAGQFEASIDSDALTGNWFAVDLGQYAFWTASGTGDANSITLSSGGSGLMQIFSAQSFLFVGDTGSGNTSPPSNSPPTTNRPSSSTRRGQARAAQPLFLRPVPSTGRAAPQ